MLDIFLVQMDVVADNKAINFDKVRDLLLKARIKKEGQSPEGIIVLPEMFATGYLPKDCEGAAEDFADPHSVTASFLQSIADETGYAVSGAGIQKGLFNHVGVFMPRGKAEAACYNKRKPFFPEQVNFIAGDSANLYKINNWSVSSTICFDLRFPELFRDAVKKGAQLITVQAAWPKSRINHWKILLQARAIENQAYIAAVNTVTTADSPNALGGTSMIISPLGEIIAEAPCNQETVLCGRISSAPQAEYRKNFPVLSGLF